MMAANAQSSPAPSEHSTQDLRMDTVEAIMSLREKVRPHTSFFVHLQWQGWESTGCIGHNRCGHERHCYRCCTVQLFWLNGFGMKARCAILGRNRLKISFNLLRCNAMLDLSYGSQRHLALVSTLRCMSPCVAGHCICIPCTASMSTCVSSHGSCRQDRWSQSVLKSLETWRP